MASAALVDGPEVREALRLEPGGVYVIEYHGILSREACGRIESHFDEYSKKLGVKFMLLTGGLRIARQSVDEAAK